MHFPPNPIQTNNPPPQNQAIGLPPQNQAIGLPPQNQAIGLPPQNQAIGPLPPMATGLPQTQIYGPRPTNQATGHLPSQTFAQVPTQFQHIPQLPLSNPQQVQHLFNNPGQDQVNPQSLLQPPPLPFLQTAPLFSQQTPLTTQYPTPGQIFPHTWWNNTTQTPKQTAWPTTLPFIPTLQNNYSTLNPSDHLANAQYKYAMSTLPAQYITFKGSSSKTGITTKLARIESQISPNCTDKEKIEAVLQAFADCTEVQPIIEAGWDSSYKDLKEWLTLLYDKPNSEPHVADWADITPTNSTNFRDWQIEHAGLIGFTYKNWASMDDTNRVLVMRGLEKAVPRAAINTFRTGSNIDPLKFRNKSFHEIIQTISSHATNNSHLWTNQRNDTTYTRSFYNIHHNNTSQRPNNPQYRPRPTTPGTSTSPRTSNTQNPPFPRDPNAFCENHKMWGHSTSQCKTGQPYCEIHKQQGHSTANCYSNGTVSLPRDKNGYCANHQIYGHTTAQCKFPPATPRSQTDNTQTHRRSTDNNRSRSNSRERPNTPPDSNYSYGYRSTTPSDSNYSYGHNPRPNYGTRGGQSQRGYSRGGRQNPNYNPRQPLMNIETQEQQNIQNTQQDNLNGPAQTLGLGIIAARHYTS